MNNKRMSANDLQDEITDSSFKYFDPYPCEYDSHPFTDLEEQSLKKSTSKPSRVRLS